MRKCEKKYIGVRQAADGDTAHKHCLPVI